MNLTLLLVFTMLFSAVEETGEWVNQGAAFQPTPTPAATPVPSPSPRIIQLELYFRRPAKIIPIHNQEDEFEIVQEVPWLTGKDIAYISQPVDKEPIILLLHLTPEGNQKYREAMMGNVGRTIVFSLDGTSRCTTKMVPVSRKNRMRVFGNFTFREATRIADQINNRPKPTPTPVPSPSPSKRQRFIIE